MTHLVNDGVMHDFSCRIPPGQLPGGMRRTRHPCGVSTMTPSGGNNSGNDCACPCMD
ncbi:hypothetical protein GGR62_003849 [Xanthomonas campestris]|nr:hypothetical protein [Xanthomonas sp. 3075]